MELNSGRLFVDFVVVVSLLSSVAKECSSNYVGNEAFSIRIIKFFSEIFTLLSLIKTEGSSFWLILLQVNFPFNYLGFWREIQNFEHPTRICVKSVGLDFIRFHTYGNFLVDKYYVIMESSAHRPQVHSCIHMLYARVVYPFKIYKANHKIRLRLTTLFTPQVT